MKMREMRKYKDEKERDRWMLYLDCIWIQRFYWFNQWVWCLFAQMKSKSGR